MRIFSTHFIIWIYGWELCSVRVWLCRNKLTTAPFQNSMLIHSYMVLVFSKTVVKVFRHKEQCFSRNWLRIKLIFWSSCLVQTVSNDNTHSLYIYHYQVIRTHIAFSPSNNWKRVFKNFYANKSNFFGLFVEN